MNEQEMKSLHEISDIVHGLAKDLEEAEDSVHSAVFQLRYVATKHLLQCVFGANLGGTIKHVCQASEEEEREAKRLIPDNFEEAIEEATQLSTFLLSQYRRAKELPIDSEINEDILNILFKLKIINKGDCIKLSNDILAKKLELEKQGGE